MEFEISKLQVLVFVLGVILFLFIGNLIRKKKLREEYGAIWLAASLLMIGFAIWRDGLDIVAGFIGIYYAPSMAFMFAIFILILICIQLLVAVSGLQEKVKTLSQDMALYKQKSEESDKGKG